MSKQSSHNKHVNVTHFVEYKFTSDNQIQKDLILNVISWVDIKNSK